MNMDKPTADLRNAEKGKPSRLGTIGHLAVGGMAAALRDIPLSVVTDPTIRGALDALGNVDKSKTPPPVLDHTSPLAKFIRVRFDGEVRPDDVLSYNVEEGWIVCGRYNTINGQRIWRRERGRILSFTKKGKVEPFWR
jgi:hypothetical protein